MSALWLTTGEGKEAGRRREREGRECHSASPLFLISGGRAADYTLWCRSCDARPGRLGGNLVHGMLGNGVMRGMRERWCASLWKESPSPEMLVATNRGLCSGF